ncbi:hypothetical protein ACEPAF_4743 [Sanghuangporus sanghuang]
MEECPRGREVIRAIIAAFVPADRKALFEELGQVKESSFEEVNDINVQAVPAELEELVDSEGFFSSDSLKYNHPVVQYQDANISDSFTLRKLLTDIIPDKPEADDKNFDVYTDLLVRKVNAQAGNSNKLSVEERNQTAIKNEVEVEAPYRKNVVAQVNDTEAVWDVVGRCAAEVWHEGIVDADQFVRRAGGKELDAFVSIIHPKIAGNDEVDLSNPLLEEENFIDAHALINSGCTVFNADGTSNEAGLIKEYVVHNPEIDWRSGTVKFTRCPDECELSLPSKEIDEEFVRNVRMKEAAKWPPYLEEYADIFSEESFERLPNHRT